MIENEQTQQQQQQQQQEEEALILQLYQQKYDSECYTSSKTGGYQILEIVPHDTAAYTQGLVTFSSGSNSNNENGVVNASYDSYYESTGRRGQSQVRVIDLRTGKVRNRRELDGRYFGEGLALFYPETVGNTINDGRLIQLTWTSKTGIIYDASTLRRLRTFRFETSSGRDEGWGITYRSSARREFYVTDGSHYLYAWDADTLRETRRAAVYTRRKASGGGNATEVVPVKNLNELEYDSRTNTVLANVWRKNNILRIDPDTGLVKKVYDFGSLAGRQPASADVLNGIALSNDGGKSDEIWVTGKLWPRMYRVRLLE